MTNREKLDAPRHVLASLPRRPNTRGSSGSRTSLTRRERSDMGRVIFNKYAHDMYLNESMKCLESILDLVEDGKVSDLAARALKCVDAAIIGEEPRNCDIGSPQGQRNRWEKFCDRHYVPDENGGDCGDCPLAKMNNKPRECSFAWMHLPFRDEK